MDLWNVLSKIHDFISRHNLFAKVRNSLLFFLTVGATIAELSDFRGGLSQVFTSQSKIEKRLGELISEIDADKAGAFVFKDGERRIIADVSQSGALPITNSNRVVSLSVSPFDELLATNRGSFGQNGKCWIYAYPKDGKHRNQLDDGMGRSKNRQIISCPVFRNGALKGTVGAGWGRYLSKQEIEQKSKAVQQAADDIAPML